MTKTISALFKDAPSAREALIKLEAIGFTEKQISVVATDDSLGQSFHLEKGSKVAEGTSIGASTGGIIGAISAGLIATGSLVIPGVNLLVYGSAIAALAGVGAGATIGGLTGALIGLGIPEYEAKQYEDQVKEGSVLVAVEAPNANRANIAKELLEYEGGHQINK